MYNKREIRSASYSLISFRLYVSKRGNSKSTVCGNISRQVLVQANAHKYCTGKSLSEALILASTNPQYDNRLFIELPVQYMKITSSEHVVYRNWVFFVFV